MGSEACTMDLGVRAPALRRISAPRFCRVGICIDCRKRRAGSRRGGTFVGASGSRSEGRGAKRGQGKGAGESPGGAGSQVLCTAYVDLAPTEAQDLLLTAFPDVLKELNADPARILSNLDIEKPLGDNGALVANGRGGSALLESPIPVETEYPRQRTSRSISRWKHPAPATSRKLLSLIFTSPNRSAALFGWVTTWR